MASSLPPLRALPLKYRRKSLTASDVEDQLSAHSPSNACSSSPPPRRNASYYTPYPYQADAYYSSASSSPVASSAMLSSIPNSPVEYARIREQSSPIHGRASEYAVHARDLHDDEAADAITYQDVPLELHPKCSAYSAYVRTGYTVPLSPLLPSLDVRFASRNPHHSPSDASEELPLNSDYGVDGLEDGDHGARDDDPIDDGDDMMFDMDILLHRRRISFSTSAEREKPFVRPRASLGGRTTSCPPAHNSTTLTMTRPIPRTNSRSDPIPTLPMSRMPSDVCNRQPLLRLDGPSGSYFCATPSTPSTSASLVPPLPSSPLMPVDLSSHFSEAFNPTPTPSSSILESHRRSSMLPSPSLSMDLVDETPMTRRMHIGGQDYSPTLHNAVQDCPFTPSARSFVRSTSSLFSLLNPTPEPDSMSKPSLLLRLHNDTHEPPSAFVEVHSPVNSPLDVEFASTSVELPLPSFGVSALNGDCAAMLEVNAIADDNASVSDGDVIDDARSSPLVSLTPSRPSTPENDYQFSSPLSSPLSLCHTQAHVRAFPSSPRSSPLSTPPSSPRLCVQDVASSPSRPPAVDSSVGNRRPRKHTGERKRNHAAQRCPLPSSSAAPTTSESKDGLNSKKRVRSKDDGQRQRKRPRVSHPVASKTSAASPGHDPPRNDGAREPTRTSGKPRSKPTTTWQDHGKVDKSLLEVKRRKEGSNERSKKRLKVVLSDSESEEEDVAAKAKVRAKAGEREKENKSSQGRLLGLTTAAKQAEKEMKRKAECTAEEEGENTVPSSSVKTSASSSAPSRLNKQRSSQDSLKHVVAPTPSLSRSIDLPLPLTELQGMLIETLATSRASSLPASSLYNGIIASRPALKDSPSISTGGCMSKNEWIAVIEDVLETGCKASGVFDKVENNGKGSADHMLEAQWFYVPEKDDDQERATLIRSMMPRPGKRSETKKSKQYYWRPLGKISRWDPEDDL
ncbi:uncharacterized protein FIBRA_06027 [Fibroporia radiculosa]|uniref:Uncharacterized protein n=1 Tax=Fibroporia radiculosa TaxID=599839 RepID=J4IB16_9APHY|nr:uncharacterized protein FIBRA_06027 [Fibroporia radiculosa]CCM03876.1 predicted protein [Fibroporia radiculosa]